MCGFCKVFVRNMHFWLNNIVYSGKLHSLEGATETETETGVPPKPEGRQAGLPPKPEGRQPGLPPKPESHQSAAAIIIKIRNWKCLQEFLDISLWTKH